MELVVLVLCIAFAAVTIAALICGGLRLKKNSDELKAETAKETLPAPNVVLVKQTAGDVRIAYLAEKSTDELVKKETVKEETAVAEAAPAEEREEETAQDGVLIPKAEKLTFEERYQRLPASNKKLLDAFVSYVEGKEDCEKRVQTSALLCRYKKSQIAKVVIRRDCAVLSFPIANPELGRLVREEKLKSVKMQPAQIKLATKDDLELAKQTADITLEYLQSEEEYKLEKRREARREAAKKKREEDEEA